MTLSVLLVEDDEGFAVTDAVSGEEALDLLPTRVVSREHLPQRVWGYDYYGDTRLPDVHIRCLRREVEHDPDDPKLIVTVRGVGYRVDL